ncbi:unnamed protein product, partial [marine sediment metagenome]
MKAMESMKDNEYDLAIVDPPYGLERFKKGIGKNDRHKIKAGNGFNNLIPNKYYFSELKRVSKKQIIWGANNFTLPKSEYFIIWDKKLTVDNFASAEYAWTNCKKPAKVFRYVWNGMIQNNMKNKEIRIHPTQKPVQLYKWLLKNYGFNKDGSKRSIVDTHGGSMSIALACHDMKFSLDLWELDEDYYKAGV